MEYRCGIAIRFPFRSAKLRYGESVLTIIVVPSRWPRWTIFTGTPLRFITIASGARMKLAFRFPAVMSSTMAEKFVYRLETKREPDSECWVTQLVTGQVRCHVTGRCPTTSSPPLAAAGERRFLSASTPPCVSLTCSAVTTARNSPTAAIGTVFPLKVGG